MPHEALDFRRRAQLSELMDEPCSREVIEACLRDLARVNRWFGAYRPLLHWLDEVRPQTGSEPLRIPLRILDVGCGYGDGLRRIERWARRRAIPVELTGIDLNPDSIAIAESQSDRSIRWVAGDVFAYRSSRPFDLIVSSLFTHHLGDSDVVRFVGWMEHNAEMGWFINDLSRAAVPYHLFRWFARLAGLHPFVQHDGPVSIARAFVPEEWRQLCARAGLAQNEFELLSYKPARLCVSRRKPR
jgi:SAM-dependent methyltransferase